MWRQRSILAMGGMPVTAFVAIAIASHSNCCVVAKDFIVTIGGGYDPSGNQASLEANVLFFQQVLREQHPAAYLHDVFFADGLDDGADVQAAVPSDRSRGPATELIAVLHRQGDSSLEYRNHRVPEIAGAIRPDPIRASILRIAQTVQSGDRVIVYVTAHGEEAVGRDPYNTTISCWNKTSISMRELTGWLDQVPVDVPVILVMAQCYCGGFSHTIFKAADSEQGLAEHRRIGFFAQQHDLAAAGCRPDIENDEEYSSYFWGALTGHSRTGKPMPGCDADANGVVSFAEAHAQAIVASETIDIPLKSSDVLLRRYSRIPEYTFPQDRPRRSRPGSPAAGGREESSTEEAAPAPERREEDTPLQHMAGPVAGVLTSSSPAEQRIVRELCRQLGFSETDDVASILTADRDHRETAGFDRRGPRQRSSSGRRELLAEVGAKWPAADREAWSKSPLLRDENQEVLLAEIQKLAGYEVYRQRREERTRQTELAQAHELRGVKLRRLIDALETAVLARNLPLVATPEIAADYRRMIDLEQTSLSKP